MRVLDRKLLRELLQLRAQVAAIVAVLASGVGAFVGMASAWASLEAARIDFYEESRFADVFASLVRAPLSVAEQIAALPGVEEVAPRIVAGANIDVPFYEEPVRGTMVSLPRLQGTPALNAVYLRSGRLPSQERSDEVLVHEAFAQAHALGPGDELRAVLNGKLQPLRIVGVALSPEYVYQVAPGSLFPDDERHAVIWMNEEALAQAFDMDGAFNDLSLRLGRGQAPAPVIAQLDRLLATWGGVGAYEREDQASNQMLQQELDGLQTQAIFVPAIFLGVAAFLLQVVLGRIISGQREIIAVLKAMGHGTFSVGLHYLKLVMLVCVAGGVLGSLLGLLLGRWMVAAYVPFFRFPSLVFVPQPSLIAVGVVVAVAAGVAATFGSVRRIVTLPPAVAMRPPAPATYRPLLLERLGLTKRLPPAASMVMRRLERTPLRSALSSLGVALSLAILLAVSGLMGSIDLLMDVAFHQEQRQDITLTFIEAQGEGVAYEVGRLPGVLEVEPVRNVAARLRAGHRYENLALQGLPPDGKLRRILGSGGEEVGLPPEGFLLSRELGRKLGVAEGAEVWVEVLEERRQQERMIVAGLVDDMMGLNAYLSLDALHRLMGEGRRITGALVTLDETQLSAFLAEVDRTPLIAGAQRRTAAIEEFDETMAATQTLATAILGFFASIIAVGVVYNTARIILADSSRELASLRVLGFTKGEISRIFLGELAAIVAFALPLGWALGWAFAWLISRSLPAELYRLQIHIPADSLLRSIAIILAATAASALLARRRLDRLDLVGVLKTRE